MEQQIPSVLMPAGKVTLTPLGDSVIAYDEYLGDGDDASMVTKFRRYRLEYRRAATSDKKHS